MEFQNMTEDMQRMFMSWYNEQTGKKPIWFVGMSILVCLVVGFVILYKIPRIMGVVGGYVPTWYGVLFILWLVVSVFGGAKLGVRLYHKVYRDTLLSALQSKVMEADSLTEQQKDVLKNYTVYYVDTATFKMSDM